MNSSGIWFLKKVKFNNSSHKLFHNSFMAIQFGNLLVPADANAIIQILQYASL